MKKSRAKIYLTLFFTTFLFSLFLISCQEKNTERAVPTRLPQKKMDSLTAWLENLDNFNNKSYMPKFYAHLDSLKKEKKWEDAALLLSVVGACAYVNSVSDKALIKTSIDFMNQHEKDISDGYKTSIYHNIGSLYYFDANIEASLKYLKKSTQVAGQDFDSQQFAAKSYREMCYDYSESGKHEEALKAGLAALDKAELIRDSSDIAASNDALGAVYRALYDYENSEKCYDRGLMYMPLNQTYARFILYLNKVGLYELYKPEKLASAIDTAYQYFNENKLNNDAYKLFIYSLYAEKLLKEDQIEKAEKIIAEIKPIFDQATEKFLYSEYFRLANLYAEKTGKKIIPNHFFTSGITYYQKNKNLLGLKNCYLWLKQDASQRKDYKNAFLFQEKYYDIEDSLRTEKAINKAKELDKKYLTAKKEKQILVQEAKISQQKTLILTLGSSLIMLLLGGSIYYLWQKQKTLKQEKMNSMNFTKQLLESTEDERKRIASDLHDSVSHELLSLKTMLKGDFSELNSKVDAIINDIRGISRNLHPVMFDKIGLQANIEQLIERVAIQHDFLVNTEIDYKDSLSSSTELQIYRIIQESLTNIIKHANAHAAKISIEEMADKICVEIRDNGKGFNVKETLNSNKAFGLHNIIERSRVMGGKAKIKSSEEGTIITISVPKNT
jgi:two-component system, NarL family, sensor kinase